MGDGVGWQVVLWRIGCGLIVAGATGLGGVWGFVIAAGVVLCASAWFVLWIDTSGW